MARPVPQLTTARVKIMTVDPANMVIQAALKDGGAIQIAIWEVAPAWRWPIEGEVWTAVRRGNTWFLGSRVEQPDEASISALQPGDLKLDGTQIFDALGNALGGASQVGTFAQRPAANALPAGTFYFATDDGTVVGATPNRVAVLPASPIDGQEIHYVADAANSVLWHLKYNAGSASAYKWEFVGGSPVYAVVNSQDSISSDSTWRDPGVAGPDFVAPLAGDYMLDARCSMFANGVASDMQMGLAAPAGTPATGNAIADYQPTAVHNQPTSLVIKVTMTAGATMRMRYWGNGGAGQFVTAGTRHLAATPVRVG